MADELRIAPPFRMWAFSSPNAGRVPGASFLQNQQGLYYSDILMVVDLVLGANTQGVRIRLASEPVYVLDGTQDKSAIAGLLEEPPIVAAYSLGEATSQARSFAFGFLPTADFDLPSLIANGLIPHGIAEVSLHYRRFNGSASVYTERMVICRGVVSGMTFGGRYPGKTQTGDRISRGVEAVQFEVVDPRDIVQSWIPPYMVDGPNGRFVNPHPSAIGQRLPIIYNGYPNIPAVRITRYVDPISTGTSNNTFVFAVGDGFTVDTAALTSGVRVNGVQHGSGDTIYSWTQQTVTDTKGIVYSAIYFDTDSAPPGQFDGWKDGDTVQVTVTRPGDAGQLNLMQIIQDICVRYTNIGSQGLNIRLFAEAEAKLMQAVGNPQVLLNGSDSSSAANALDFIETGLLKSYPMVSMVWEDGAYGPIVTDYRSRPTAKFVVGAVPILDRVSEVQTSNVSDLYNGFIIRYNYDPLLNAYSGFVTRDRTNSDVCAYSETLVGRRDFEVFESPYITDETTANFIADWLVAHYAIPSYLVEYEALPVAFFNLRRGDTILLTDDEFSWTEQRATIEAIEYRRGYCKLTLRVWARFLDFNGSAFSYGG
jgi:hypothetical protein